MSAVSDDSKKEIKGKPDQTKTSFNCPANRFASETHLPFLVDPSMIFIVQGRDIFPQHFAQDAFTAGMIG